MHTAENKTTQLPGSLNKNVPGKVPFFQPKLTINQPGDQYEQEADRMADHVMCMPADSLSFGEGRGEVFFKPSPVSISQMQRKCKECEDEEKLQRKENSSQATDASSEVSSYINSLSSKGSPLPESSRSFFEPRFGHDFSGVRIHNDADAEKSSQSVNALAYTVGNNIVFNQNQFSPESDGAKKLLAHELTHVIQQENNHILPNIQRNPNSITGTKSSITSFDVTMDGGSPHQVKSGSRSVGFADLKMSYDEATSVFLVTFPLAWIFPHPWPDKQRSDFVKNFESSVQRVWQDRFLLKETVGKHRSAHVEINFSEIIIPQAKDSFDEGMALGKILQDQSVWVMDVRDPNVRANVKGTIVQLDQDANKSQKRKVSDIRASKGFSAGDVSDNKTFTQTTSAHEFGHMIGLGDEYLNDVGTTPGNISENRGNINDRIMNVGENVTADVYAPFADWLSDLTSTNWKVDKKIH